MDKDDFFFLISQMFLAAALAANGAAIGAYVLGLFYFFIAIYLNLRGIAKLRKQLKELGV
jgi:hypothetical protein